MYNIKFAKRKTFSFRCISPLTYRQRKERLDLNFMFQGIPRACPRKFDFSQISLIFIFIIRISSDFALIVPTFPFRFYSVVIETEWRSRRGQIVLRITVCAGLVSYQSISTVLNRECFSSVSAHNYASA